MSQQKKKKVEQIIEETAKATASEVIVQQRQARQVNHYRAMERLLRNYPRLKKLVENVEDYGFVPVERSKSITIAPPSGGMMRDRTEILEEVIADRQVSYERTKARFDEIDAVVKQFENDPEFIVIRMYYFNENAHGMERDPDSKAYTFEEISEELASVGIFRSEKTLRSWRTRIVQDMTVTLFGVDGALSVESREKPMAAASKIAPDMPKEE